VPNSDIAAIKAAVLVVIIAFSDEDISHISGIHICYSHPGKEVSTIRNFFIKVPYSKINRTTGGESLTST
jgi:hypothetical protein